MKKVWILNHYATFMYKDTGGRHYWFAEQLIKQGFGATIFCANTYHNSAEVISIHSGKYTKSSVNDIPFVFVKTLSATGNGFKRIVNMLLFAFNLLFVLRDYAKDYGKPDIILASCPHTFTCLAGLRFAKKIKVPCICEIRDLWPLTLIDFSITPHSNSRQHIYD